MPRIFIDSLPVGDELSVGGKEASYLIKVLRVRVGDEVTLIGEGGRSWLSEIESIKGREIKFSIKKEIEPLKEPSIKIHLLQGILKAQKMDLVVQKAVELGVSSIVPVITERTIVTETKKKKRWQDIALEATRQCGRTIIPVVEEPIRLRDFFLKRCPISGIVFWEEGGLPLKDALRAISPKEDIYILIGPEGGLGKEEVEGASRCGLKTATLGRRLLRAETASISALTIVQFFLGDMG